jgi:hypothetical protein
MTKLVEQHVKSFHIWSTNQHSTASKGLQSLAGRRSRDKKLSFAHKLSIVYILYPEMFVPSHPILPPSHDTDPMDKEKKTI